MTLSFKKLKTLNVQQVFPFILIVAGVVGLLASFILIQEHNALLKDPNYIPSCSINPVLSCGPVMQSSTATVFGFPNPLIGIATFSVQILLGVVLLAKAKMKSWFWKLYSLEVVGGLLFMFYLMYESLFVIKAICVYCLGVWIVLLASSWYTLQYMLAEGHLSKLSKKPFGLWLRRHHFDVLFVAYLILAALILEEFWYYYGPKLGL